MNRFIKLVYDPSGERYLRDDSGDEVRFPKLLHVLLDTEECDIKLSYTRELDSLPTKRPVPVLKVDGEKIRLDDDRIEVAEDCLLAYVA